MMKSPEQQRTTTAEKRGQRDAGVTSDEETTAPSDPPVPGDVAAQSGTAPAGEGAPAADGAPPGDVEDTIESLREKLAAAEEGALRAKADFLNAQRRQEKSRDEAVRFANAELMRSLLGVLDDFDRSLRAVKTAANIDAVVEGIRMVYENFKKALRDQGLEEIDAVDQPFDPHIHEAVLMQPSADKAPNTVIEQVAKGFRLHDRVLRPAKVILSQAAESGVPHAGDSPEENNGPGVDVDA